MRIVGVVILTIERQAADIEMLESEIVRRERFERVRQLLVERTLAKASDHHSDLVDHDVSLSIVGKIGIAQKNAGVAHDRRVDRGTPRDGLSVRQ
ncbi:hypothetical protein [Candidatus Burkholderia verschuerenii]|uniref:hypothetical protein n=1 Tax=Candidatus Burkholderia verschuerenii TaxID=242163 RepID=UPI001E6054C7|nr:hypothetical protein [Candidatus Burkholderia verschuerenii]